MRLRVALRTLPMVFACFALPLMGAETSSIPEPSSVANAAVPAGMCPLNSGGPSLLGTSWQLKSVYGNAVPPELVITMQVEERAMSGFAGCNNYNANFKQVGNRGFKVIQLDQTRAACNVLVPEVGQPSINVGNWEGNYLRVLRRAGSVQQVNEELHFFDFNGKESVIFGKPSDDTQTTNDVTPTDPATNVNNTTTPAIDASTETPALTNQNTPK